MDHVTIYENAVHLIERDGVVVPDNVPWRVSAVYEDDKIHIYLEADPITRVNGYLLIAVKLPSTSSIPNSLRPFSLPKSDDRSNWTLVFEKDGREHPPLHFRPGKWMVFLEQVRSQSHSMAQELSQLNGKWVDDSDLFS